MVEVPKTVFSQGSGLSERNSHVNSRCCSPRNGVLARVWTARTQQSPSLAKLMSQEYCFGAILNSRDATVTLIRDAQFPGMVFWQG
eukprot:770562-Pyramimonas_sp.AAC.1